MNALNERLDDVGYTSKNEDNYHMLIFRWMQQATVEIDRLTTQVERLTEEVKPG